ncbi:hypothetical protein [Mesorhizobium abyssinicae]|uniref:hypothetical protein n=1 Tax=Mesorhizobium TaxID=68287 RepID=UPI002A243754|nr:hypothetical protein [Mesorhizobium abyssinicae]MDX8434725.1 hypothetical protein [Mesorhizobium abyssinicae]
MAELITTGRNETPLDDFRIDRFSGAAQRSELITIGLPKAGSNDLFWETPNLTASADIRREAAIAWRKNGR